MSRRVLVISIHPDDETLGCGGTLLKHVAGGEEVHWVIVTQAYEPVWSKEVIQKKIEEVQEVSKAYGMASVRRLGFPANGLDRIPLDDLVEGLRRAIVETGPDTVYLVHGQDIHTDHQVGFQAATVVLKPFHTPRLGVRRILAYETLSSTDAAPPVYGRVFVPNAISDVTPYIEKKIEIMKIYATEAQPEPLPRSPSAIRALARFRGATIGAPFAEAFMVIREVF
jgi:LmbE family N-acetylglucosaminyl deacetylase